MSELERKIKEIEENENDFQKLFWEMCTVYPLASVGQEMRPEPREISCSFKGRWVEIKWRPERGFYIFLDRTEEPVPGSEEQEVTYLDIQGVMSYLRDLFL